MQDARPSIRYQWIPLILVVAGLALLGALVMQRLAYTEQSTAPQRPTITSLMELRLDRPALTMRVPSTWPRPVVRIDGSLVLSADGSDNTTTTAGPFLYIVPDALDAFRELLTFRTDLSSPQEQLDALILALNRDRARFEAAEPYFGSNYEGAIVRGIERGNELSIVLLRTPDGRWVYVGAQAREADFRFFELTVFKPVTDSIMLANR